jgi:hypothetical protein
MLMSMGCAAVPPEQEEVPVRGETGRRCDASPAQSLVGSTASDAVGREALRLSGAAILRWIPEGGVVTMDYREDRLNLELDGRNRIVRVRCG